MSKSKKAMFLQEWKEQVGNNMEQFHEGTALMVRKHQSQTPHTTPPDLHSPPPLPPPFSVPPHLSPPPLHPLPLAPPLSLPQSPT